MKKLLVISSIALLLLLLVACTKTVTVDETMFDMNRTVDGTDADGLLNDADEMERYASYEVAVVCSFAKAGASGNGTQFLEAMNNTADLLEEYGFTAQEAESLVNKYEDDSVFLALAEEKIQAQCPEEYAAMNLEEAPENVPEE